MAKRPVPLYDFKAFGAAIKAADVYKRQLMSDMVGDCEETIMDNIIMLGEHGITVETANDDMEMCIRDRHMIVVRLRKREVIDLIQLSGQQTSLILHVPFQRYSRLVQTNIC